MPATPDRQQSFLRYRPAVAALLLFLALSFYRPSAAVSYTVCPGGSCDFTTIQAAVNVAANGDTIRLLFTGTHMEKGIVVARNVTLRGLGSSTIVQAAASQGVATDRVFYIANGHTVHLRDFTIRYGKVAGDGGAIFNDGSHLRLSSMWLRQNEALNGGAIYSDIGGRLTLDNVTVIHNKGSYNGGGIYNAGTMEADRLGLLSNTAEDRGGGLYNDSTADTWLRHSQVNDNALTPQAFLEQEGGGIYNLGILRVTDSYMVANMLAGSSSFPAGGGGGIQQSQGTLIISDSMLAINGISSYQLGANISLKGGSAQIIRTQISGGQMSSASAGGLYVSTTGAAEIRDSVISSNHGSGISWSSGDLHIKNSTIQDNTSNRGGGLYACGASGSLRLSNVTISGNQTTHDGGGIYVCGNTSLTLANVTISNNTADYDDADSYSGNGGGIYVSSSGLVTMRNSILAGNIDGTNFIGLRSGNCYGALNSAGYNVIGSLGFSLGNNPPCSVTGNTAGNQIGVDPLLQGLQDNGGFTQTHALPAASPAVDGGNPAGCLDGDGFLSLSDQRGALRPNLCDSGAYEYGGLVEHLYLPLIRRQP